MRGGWIPKLPYILEDPMKRFLMVLSLSGVTFLAATAPASRNSQLTSSLALLCPDCYANYLALHPNAAN